MSKQYYFDGLVMENILSFFEKGKHSVKLALAEGVYIKLLDFDLSEEHLAKSKRTHSYMTQLARFKIVSRTNKTLMISSLVNGIWSIPRRKAIKLGHEIRPGGRPRYARKSWWVNYLSKGFMCEYIEFKGFSVCGKDKMTCIYDEKEWKIDNSLHKKKEMELRLNPNWEGLFAEWEYNHYLRSIHTEMDATLVHNSTIDL